MQESVMVHVLGVDCLLHLYYQVFSHDPQTKKWYISATLLYIKLY